MELRKRSPKGRHGAGGRPPLPEGRPMKRPCAGAQSERPQQQPADPCWPSLQCAAAAAETATAATTSDTRLRCADTDEAEAACGMVCLGLAAAAAAAGAVPPPKRQQHPTHGPPRPPPRKRSRLAAPGLRRCDSDTDSSSSAPAAVDCEVDSGARWPGAAAQGGYPWWGPPPCFAPPPPWMFPPFTAGPGAWPFPPMPPGMAMPWGPPPFMPPPPVVMGVPVDPAAAGSRDAAQAPRQQPSERATPPAGAPPPEQQDQPRRGQRPDAPAADAAVRAALASLDVAALRCGVVSLYCEDVYLMLLDAWRPDSPRAADAAAAWRRHAAGRAAPDLRGLLAELFGAARLDAVTAAAVAGAGAGSPMIQEGGRGSGARDCERGDDAESSGSGGGGGGSGDSDSDGEEAGCAATAAPAPPKLALLLPELPPQPAAGG
ncbi:hypothetical protein Rsub_11492 [Raphidocelis subcapitata]|uniref:Uncharacterized protein n=1 Tax=Raphidocelis subcapitata TaxID=307507 RepID=A0A2V0PF75_9CHLO|nr:hypothetical protein Rsub_11492 [Raphidocelis subcapitata]|eukprot:GBF98501.1 hypothetical protein Rsub_11492 [Raphidocelis subcapitata]